MDANNQDMQTRAQAPARRATDQQQQVAPQTFAELVALVLRNSERLDDLEERLETLQAWINTYPPDAAREIFATLMRTEIDESRTIAEAALRALAETVHGEVAALRDSMTEGTEGAITALREEVRGFAASVDTSVDWATRLTLLRGILEKQEAVSGKMQQLITANERWWTEERQEREATAAREAREKRKRLERESRRMARKRRRDKTVGGIVTPLLLMAFGGFNAYLFNRAATLPPATTLLMVAGIMAVAGGFSYYWLVWRTPPDEEDIEERDGDHPPPPAPEPPDDTQAAGAGG